MKLTIFINRECFTSNLKFGLNTIDIIDCLCPLKMSKGGRQRIIMPARTEVVAQSAPFEEVSETGTLAAEASADPQPAAVEAAASSTPQAMISETTAPTTATERTSDIDQILESIEELRESLATNLGDLKTVAAKREQKTTEKEFQSFRQTLKTLQGVKL